MTSRPKDGKHDFFVLMGATRESIVRDYDRIRRRSREDPGTAGDQVEEDWAEVLRRWLPAYYPVVTKGRIVFQDGTASPQIDVLVLAPSYPLGLRQQKHFFVGGVVAAFECKLTLRSSDPAKAFRVCASIKRKVVGVGTPFDELNSAPVVGLLAHSLAPGKGRRKSWRLYDMVERHQEKSAQHPRELIDVICVADAATIPLAKHILIEPHMTSEEREELDLVGMRSAVSSMYVIHEEDEVPDVAREQVGAILAGLVWDLTVRLAYRDSALRPWAGHLSALGFYGGIGRPIYWTEDVLSAAVRRELKKKRALKSDLWEPWQKDVP